MFLPTRKKTLAVRDCGVQGLVTQYRRWLPGYVSSLRMLSSVREISNCNPVGHLDKVMCKTMNANSDARTYRLSKARVEETNRAGCGVHTKITREWPSRPTISGS